MWFKTHLLLMLNKNKNKNKNILYANDVMYPLCYVPRLHLLNSKPRYRFKNKVFGKSLDFFFYFKFRHTRIHE
jgi:hypothetical protein